MDDLFEMIADVNGKPIPYWQFRLEGMYTDYVPFGEILSLVRALIDDRAIEHILSMSDDDVIASFPGDVNKYAEEMRQKFGVLARTIRERDAAIDALRTAINSVECASIDLHGNELPWYIKAKAAMFGSEDV